jgi:hypothetical protein
MMTLQEAFQNYKGAAANAAHLAGTFYEAQTLAQKADADLKKAENMFAGMLGNGAYIHEDQVFTTFANKTISAAPIRKE